MIIPRELIYEDKKNISEFGINDVGSLNYLIYEEWLLNRVELKPFKSGLPVRMLKVFNDAYFICTLILMHPTNKDFVSYAYERVSIKSLVLSMVYLYISNIEDKPFSNSILLKTIKTGLRSEGWEDNLEALIKCTKNYSGKLFSSEFTQRKLTPELLSSKMWYKTTDAYKKDDILKIVRYVAVSKEDWVMMLDAIKNAAIDYEREYNNDLGCYYDDETGIVVEDSPINLTPVFQYCDELKERYEEESIHEDGVLAQTKNEDTFPIVDNRNNIQLVGQTEDEWDNRYDGFLKENLDAQAIFEALQNISSPNLPKTQHPFWWVFYIVLLEINWIPEKKGNQKLVLQWANNHFNCGWDWNSKRQFKFSDIDPKLKCTPSSSWDKNTMKTIAGLYYGQLAKQMKEAFVEVVPSGKLMDRKRFIKDRHQRINNGH